MRRSWVLPVGLGTLQLALWPGLVLIVGGHVGRMELLAAPPLTAGVALALSWRRRAPVAAFATLLVLAAACVALTPGGELSVAAFAQLIALYHVALRCRPATAAGAVLALLALDSVVNAAVGENLTEVAVLIGVESVLLVTVVVVGRRRREWLADRAAADRRLAEADEQRRGAADEERHRLARELHDVTAHHLTSIVVTATAAQRLQARRPELTGQALEFAAETGRSTLAALHRLVAVMRGAAPDDRDPAVGLTARLTTLADGFRRLGQRVDLELTDADAPPAVVEAAYGIAREALTNTLRYAPGARVRLRLDTCDDTVTLTVADDGTPAGEAAPTGGGAADGGIGSGRGVIGMRHRAAAVGGDADIGPHRGGWQVTARLPRTAATGPDTRRRRPGGRRLLDAALALAAVLTPLGALLADDRRLLAPPAGAVLVAVVLAHGIPLWWRRQRPWTVLAVVLGTGAAWPALIHLGAAPADFRLYLTCLVAEVVAVHAVAVHGAAAQWTWVAPVLATVAVALTLGGAVTAVLWRQPAAGPVDRPDESVAAGPGTVEFTVAWEPVASGLLAAFTAGSVSMFVFVVPWLVGLLPRHHRSSTRAHELRQIAAAEVWARAAADQERHRIAYGLREAVLAHTGQIGVAAARGDLDGVVAQARAALAAMRGLLNGLRPADGVPRDPQSGVTGITGLVAAGRNAGRDVRATVTGPPRPLPADVDVSAYRVVQLALSGPDHTPATVRVHYADTELRLTLTGVPAIRHEPVRTFLRARVAAVGGRLKTPADDAVDVRLPAPTQEVTPSPSV